MIQEFKKLYAHFPTKLNEITKIASVKNKKKMSNNENTMNVMNTTDNTNNALLKKNMFNNNNEKNEELIKFLDKNFSGIPKHLITQFLLSHIRTICHNTIETKANRSLMLTVVNRFTFHDKVYIQITNKQKSIFVRKCACVCV